MDKESHQRVNRHNRQLLRKLLTRGKDKQIPEGPGVNIRHDNKVLFEMFNNPLFKTKKSGKEKQKTDKRRTSDAILQRDSSCSTDKITTTPSHGEEGQQTELEVDFVPAAHRLKRTGAIKRKAKTEPGDFVPVVHRLRRAEAINNLRQYFTQQIKRYEDNFSTSVHHHLYMARRDKHHKSFEKDCDVTAEGEKGNTDESDMPGDWSLEKANMDKSKNKGQLKDREIPCSKEDDKDEIKNTSVLKHSLATHMEGKETDSLKSESGTPCNGDGIRRNQEQSNDEQVSPVVKFWLNMPSPIVHSAERKQEKEKKHTGSVMSQLRLKRLNSKPKHTSTPKRMKPYCATTVLSQEVDNKRDRNVSSSIPMMSTPVKSDKGHHDGYDLLFKVSTPIFSTSITDSPVDSRHSSNKIRRRSTSTKIRKIRSQLFENSCSKDDSELKSYGYL